MEKCKICGHLAVSPWRLTIQGEIQELCADSCHRPYLGNEEKDWLNGERKRKADHRKKFSKRAKFR